MHEGGLIADGYKITGFRQSRKGHGQTRQQDFRSYLRTILTYFKKVWMAKK